MEFLSYSIQHNESVKINLAHIVALRSSVNEDSTRATLEIITTAAAADFKQDFDDVGKMREEFERIERILGSSERNVIYDAAKRIVSGKL
ncbi:hypothetical protein [Hymenobacter algoricola]|uniref:Uncharacterized protein n=1 Tax=Hymenobacter algoricola TaxID=486267 RepID=A0ABP7NN88_9BACT